MVAKPEEAFLFFNFWEEVNNVDIPVIHAAEDDRLKIGDKLLENRLFTGTGKYADDAMIPEIIASQAHR